MKREPNQKFALLLINSWVWIRYSMCMTNPKSNLYNPPLLHRELSLSEMHHLPVKAPLLPDNKCLLVT